MPSPSMPVFPRRRRRAWLARLAPVVLLAALAAPAVGAPGDPVSIDAPLPGAVTGDTTPEIRGTVADPAAGDVTVTVAPGTTPAGTVTPAEDGTWSVTAPELTDGGYTATATQGTASAEAAFRVDTVPLAIAVPTGRIVEPSLTISGTGAAPGVDLDVTVDEGTVGAVTRDDDGRWTAALTGLPEGTRTVTASQPGEPAVFASFEVDLITPLTLEVAARTGARPTFRGKAEPGTGVTVDIRRGGTVVGTATGTPRANGDWTAQATAPLVDGDYSALARQGDREAGPEGFVVDAPLTMVAPADPMRVPRPTFTGAGANPDPALPLTVTLTGPTEAVLPATVDPETGAWSATVTSEDLKPGGYTVEAEQGDDSVTRQFTVLASSQQVDTKPTPTPTPTPEPAGSTPPASSAPAPAPSFTTPSPPPPTVRAPRSARILRPFPVVRIAGALTPRGARLRILSVTAPRGARIRAACLRGSCRGRVVRLRVRRAGTVRLRAFERVLRAGTVISVAVTRPGRVGKYARITIRRGQAPSRTDRCMATTGRRVIACPAG